VTDIFNVSNSALLGRSDGCRPPMVLILMLMLMMAGAAGRALAPTNG
jgi:hypothetical protein